MQSVTPEDMMQLQLDIYDGFAAIAAPLLLKYVDAATLDEKERSYVEAISGWDFNARAQTIEETIFKAWWDSLYFNIFQDDMAHVPKPAVLPDAQTLAEMLLRDSSVKYIDNNTTPEAETLVVQVTNGTHGPSWRMVVHLTTPTEAYGVYPGGQSGNPGSRFYDSFIDTWVRGNYYTLWMMKPSEKGDKRIIGTLTFTKS
jgi:penicillin amidase